MQGQKDPNENARDQLTPKADQSASDENSLSRRSAFRGGLLGIASVIAAACSGTDFVGSNSDRKKGKKASGNDGGGDGAESDGIDGADTDGDLGDVDSSDSADDNKPQIDQCAATTTQKVDTTGMPGIDEAPVVRVYGKRKLRMIAIQFSTNTTFDQLLIATSSGRVLALHIPTGADKNASGWRPIVIDPLDFDEGGAESAEVVLVIQQGNTRKQHRETLATFSTFKNLPVIDLTAATATSGWDPTRQSVARFVESKASYQEDNDPSLIYPGDRKLKTAQSTTTLTVSSTALKSDQAPIPTKDATAGATNLNYGFVTDVMGNIIPYTDLQGNGIQEIMLFCTYRPDDLNSPTKYYRTMIFVA